MQELKQNQARHFFYTCSNCDISFILFIFLNLFRLTELTFTDLASNLTCFDIWQYKYLKFYSFTQNIFYNYFVTLDWCFKCLHTK